MRVMLPKIRRCGSLALLSLTALLAACDGDETRVVNVPVEVPVEVPAANAAPVASDDLLMVGAGSEENLLDVLANDSDADGDNLVVSALSAPANGTATVFAGTRINYVPAAGFTGSDSFSYTVSDGRGESDTAMVMVTVSEVAAAFSLQLLHMADFEAAGPALEDAPRFSAVLSALRAQSPDNSLVLSSGDNYIPGPFYSAGADASLADVVGIPGNGRADIVIANQLGVQASAIGNHEFDEGPTRVAALIAEATDGTNTYPGTAFPYLSANLDFGPEPALAPLVVADAAAPQGNSLARSVIIEVDGERIGVVGATTPTLRNISSAGAVRVLPEGFGGSPEAVDIDALSGVIQGAIDALSSAGVDKIILLAHMQQISIERQLAERLRDVDIIVGGGSDTIFADDTDRLRSGDTAGGDYPEIYTSPSGEPVLLVNTDGQYRYVGRLVVGFDADGRVITDTVDPLVSGAYAADAQGVTAVEGTPLPEVVAVTDAVAEVLIAREGNILGATEVFLEGRALDTAGVRTEETNLGNLTADANLFIARQADPTVSISLKNGGGIRNFIGAIEQPAGSTDPSEAVLLPPQPIPAAGKEEGDISQFDLQGALSFNNALALITVTAAELKELLEHGIANQPSRQGRFPQIGGMAFSYDPRLPGRVAAADGTIMTAGERVRSLVVFAADGSVADVVVQDGAIVGDPARSFRMVTLNFLAENGCGRADAGPQTQQACGDGYPFGQLTAPDYVRLDETLTAAGNASFADPGTEQDALAEFLQANFAGANAFAEAETPIAEDTRIQRLDLRMDTVIPAP
jgi:2',3'-cyclic-nucleotide 2'-phosphodiesterase (5'-nucleotidase family)